MACAHVLVCVYACVVITMFAIRFPCITVCVFHCSAANQTYRISDADFTAYMAAVPHFNGSLTLGLNFWFGDNTSLATAHANAAWAFKDAAGNALSDLIQEFEIGNEVWPWIAESFLMVYCFLRAFACACMCSKAGLSCGLHSGEVALAD